MIPPPCPQIRGRTEIQSPPISGSQCGRTAKVPETTPAPRPRLEEARVRNLCPHIEEAFNMARKPRHIKRRRRGFRRRATGVDLGGR
jgi:hypothetical protein